MGEEATEGKAEARVAKEGHDGAEGEEEVAVEQGLEAEVGEGFSCGGGRHTAAAT